MTEFSFTLSDLKKKEGRRQRHEGRRKRILHIYIYISGLGRRKHKTGALKKKKKKKKKKGRREIII